jgi:hypothetical protein
VQNRFFGWDASPTRSLTHGRTRSREDAGGAFGSAALPTPERYFAGEARQLIRERAGLSERLVVDRLSVEGEGGPAEA